MKRYSNPISRRMVVSLVIVSVVFVTLFLALNTYWNYAVVLIPAMIIAIFVILTIYVQRINKVIAEQADQENAAIRRDLTQNIAHELKTPVASIRGYLETILDTPDMDEQTKTQFLRRSYAQTKRLSTLLRDISTLNNMDAKAPAYKVEDVNICRMVGSIARDTALQREDAHMILRNQLIEPIIIRGDVSLLYSVFRNLMDNAIAYAGHGTTITISAAMRDGMWHFTFRDNGSGVPEETLDRLFERFYRVDKGRSRKLGGNGLGLAIVKNAVLIHGGEISASNCENGGLKFDFTLSPNNFDDGK